MSKKVIEVNDLTKNYGDLTAVNNVSFEIEEGEIFSLVGPNGAGKTTTVEILECLREPTSGEAKVFGFDVRTEDKEIKKRIGVLPQEFNTFNRLTIKENLNLVNRIYDSKGDIKETLKKLELWETRNKKFEELSGGMKRRVGIAMALVSNPKLLFLDEPTTGLDPQARRNLWGTIKNLKKFGVTIFLTTHYMEEVEELSDKASIIMKGELLSTDTVDELVSKYGGDMKIVTESNNKARKVLEKFTENVFSDDMGNIVGKFESRKKAAEANLSLYQELSESCKIKLVEPSMEDVFIHVAGGKIDESGELIR